jgi:hypothetical protein
MLITDPLSPDFNSYASVDDLKAYATTRGCDIPATDDECVILLLQAMDYLSGIEWRGSRSSDSQSQAWPRTGVYYDGVAVPGTVIPRQIVTAQCRLAIEAQEIDLSPSFNSGGDVVQESVSGAVSISYSPGTSKSTPLFPWLNGLLRGFIGSINQVRLVRG